VSNKKAKTHLGDVFGNDFPLAISAPKPADPSELTFQGTGADYGFPNLEEDFLVLNMRKPEIHYL